MNLRHLAGVLLVVCALVLPFLLWGFRTYQLAFAATHAIAILGLNLIAGQAGLISLGHGAFFLQFWPDLAATVSRDLVQPVFGAILVLSMRFMPEGIAGMVWSRRAMRRGERGWRHPS